MSPMQNKTLLRPLLLILTLFIAPLPVYATFSVIACEPETGICGAAVVTNNLAVGASVPHVQAGVGALVSQFETHPGHGPTGLQLLALNKTPEQVLQILLANDDNFDGGSLSDRQIAIIDSKRNIVNFTGDNALASQWAGYLQSPGASFQGNGLAGEAVLYFMQKAWRDSSGSLASRLLTSLEAAQQAGGQSSGQMSAALLVRTPNGFPFDIDLRVDAHSSPVKQLRYLLNLHQARQLMIDALRLVNSQPERARQYLQEAIGKGQSWDRILKRGIAVAIALDDEKLQAQLTRQLKELNPHM